jgi:hypothetical protein
VTVEMPVLRSSGMEATRVAGLPLHEAVPCHSLLAPLSMGS